MARTEAEVYDDDGPWEDDEPDVARCEDYPCCGHTDGLPCNWKAPDYRDPAVAAAHHIGCDHNTGYCEYEEDDDDEDDDADEDWI